MSRPVASFTMFGRGRGEKLRRTWPQRLFIAFNVVAILAALTTAAAVATIKQKVGQIQRVDLSGTAFAGTKTLTATDPINFLIVGSDSDDGLAPNDPVRAARAKEVGGIRSDTIMVVRLDPRTKQARVLSFPRDLWVNIPGKQAGRINSALEFGDGTPALLIATLKADFNLDINHYVEVNFAGFKNLVRILGGVPIYFETPVGDGTTGPQGGSSGLHVYNAGCTTLDETGALSYVRSRHFYRIINGKKKRDIRSDQARIARQQDFIKRVIKRAVKQGIRNPVKLVDFVDVATQNIALDEGTKAKDLVALGSAFRDFEASTLATYTLPTVDSTHYGAQTLDLLPQPAEPILDLFRGTASPADASTVTEAAVSVKVLNGTDKKNQAAIATDVLRTAGFQTATPGTSVPVLRTEVHYPPGQEAQAALVARHLFADPRFVADPTVTTVTVTTGPDFGVALTKARPASQVSVPTTSPSASASTSSTTSTSTTTSTTTPDAAATASTTTTTTSGDYVPGPPPPGVDCS